MDRRGTAVHHRRLTAAVLGVVALALLLSGTAAPASAAHVAGPPLTDAPTKDTASRAAPAAAVNPRPVAGLATIVLPAGDLPVPTTARPLEVRVRLAKGARVTRLLVNGTDATPRVSQRPLTASARLRVSDGLRPGTNTLLMKVVRGSTHGFARSTVVLVRSARGLVAVVSPVAGARVSAAPLAVSLAVAPSATLTAWLNGRRVTDRFAPTRSGQRAASLGPSAGLRYGRNTLTVRALTESGRVQTIVRRVTVRTDGPLADAGADVRARVGRAVTLAGGASRGVPGAGPLAHSWTVVTRPRGARVSVSGASTTSARLRADTPGRYVLRHTVTVTGLGRSGDVATPRRASSDLVSVAVSVPGSSAQITTVAPTAQGSAVTGPGIMLAGTVVPSSVPGPGVQVVVVDQATLAVTAQASYPSTSMSSFPTAVRAFMAGASTAPAYVVVSSLPGGAPATSAQARYLLLGLAQLGQTPGLRISGPFSVVALVGPSSPPLGTLWWTQAPVDGWFALAPATTSSWSFTFGDDLGLDTSVDAPGAGIANRIAWGGTALDVPTSAVATGGFQLVRASGAGTPTSSYYEVPAKLEDLSIALRDARDDGETVVLASVGTLPALSTVSGGELPFLMATVSVLADLGASPSVLLGLGAGGSYAFAGPTLPGQYPAEAGTGVPGSSGQLTAVLARQAAGGAFAPYVADVTGRADFSTSLSQVAFTTPTPWPLTSTPAQLAATTWISQQLGLGCQSSPCDVRTAYDDVTVDLTDYLARLQGLTYPSCVTVGGRCTTTPFTKADFDAVRAELVTEFDQVAAVWTYVAAVQAPYVDTQGEAAAAIDQIVSTVVNAVTPQQQATTSTILSFVTDAMWALSLVTVPELEPVVTAAGAYAVAAATAGDIVSAQGSLVGSVTAKGAALGAAIETSLTSTSAGLEALGQIVVQDPARLAAVATAAGGRWGMTADQQVAMGGLVTIGAAQNLYAGLMPAAYVPWNLAPIPTGTNPAARCGYQAPSGAERTPFENIDVTGTFIDRTPSATGATPTLYALYERGKKPHDFFDNGFYTPPASLTQAMFAPGSPGTTDAGLFAPWFWQRAYLPEGAQTPAQPCSYK